jgi:hypothetical protein
VDGVGEPINLRILGRFEADRGAVPLHLSPVPAAVLITIALAGKSSVEDIQRHIDQARGQRDSISTNSVYQQKNAIKSAGFEVADETVGKFVRYYLDPARYDIDAVRFQNGAASLAPDDLAQFDALLALWRRDPRQENPGVDPALWDPVYEARRTLIGRLERLTVSQRDQLAELPRFLRLYPRDGTLDGLRPVTDTPARKRLLIVEDQTGDQIKDLLEDAGYECELAENFGRWRELRDADVRGRFDGAIVDLHLNGDGDATGERIVKYLCEKTDIPAAVITFDPELNSYRDKGKWLAAYRIVDLVEKYQNRRYLRQLVKVAELLTGDDEQSRRERLKIWVDHVEHAAERTAETGGALAKANLTRCRTAVRKARDAIDGEAIEAAQRQVDDLYRSFPPTYS